LSKKDKLRERFLSIPKDFTWAELVTVLNSYGFIERKGLGSRRKFINENNVIISLHEPHPQKIVKRYAIKEAIEALTNIGLITDK
jgi:hypothetical protein